MYIRGHYVCRQRCSGRSRAYYPQSVSVAVAYRGGGAGGPWPPGASLGGGTGPACRG